MNRQSHRRHARPPCARGQSAVEYLVVVSLLALALVVGPESALERVFRAFADQYTKFSYAMSRP